MSAPFPYEQLIASRLEQLPALPEMADAIWLRIAAELDTDLSSDDDDFGNDPDDGDDPGTAPSGAGPASGAWGWYFLLLLAGIAFFLLSQFDHPVTNELPAETPETFRVPVTDPPVPGPGAPDLVTSPVLESLSQPDAGDVVLPSVADSANIFPAVPSEIGPDSATARSINELTGRSDNTRLDSVSTTPPGIIKDSVGGRKRPAGIKGIGPDDYRVVPQKEKKDSS